MSVKAKERPLKNRADQDNKHVWLHGGMLEMESHYVSADVTASPPWT